MPALGRKSPCAKLEVTLIQIVSNLELYRPHSRLTELRQAVEKKENNEVVKRRRDDATANFPGWASGYLFFN